MASPDYQMGVSFEDLYESILMTPLKVDRCFPFQDSLMYGVEKSKDNLSPPHSLLDVCILSNQTLLQEESLIFDRASFRREVNISLFPSA